MTRSTAIACMTAVLLTLITQSVQGQRKWEVSGSGGSAYSPDSYLIGLRVGRETADWISVEGGFTFADHDRNALVRFENRPEDPFDDISVWFDGGSSFMFDISARISPWKFWRLAPFLAAGMGVSHQTAVLPEARAIPPGVVVNTGLFREDESDTSFASIVGVGADYFVGSSWGVRLEGRLGGSGRIGDSDVLLGLFLEF